MDFDGRQLGSTRFSDKVRWTPWTLRVRGAPKRVEKMESAKSRNANRTISRRRPFLNTNEPRNIESVNSLEKVMGVEKIRRQAGLVHSRPDGIPFPPAPAHYDTITELFSGLHHAFAAHACLSEQSSNLLCFWALSTWFSDGLFLSPSLMIIGSALEGQLVLRTLRSFCRYPVMLTRAEISSPRKMNWATTPTLLFSVPCAAKQIAATLDCNAYGSYLLSATNSGYADPPKAILVESETSLEEIPQNVLQVRLQPITRVSTAQASQTPTRAAVQDLRNQLLRYRTRNLAWVYQSDFDACALAPDTRAVANALGACIVDSPKLQSKLVALLAPVESRLQIDRAISVDSVALMATLDLIDQNKTADLFNGISNDVKPPRPEALPRGVHRTPPKQNRSGHVQTW